MRLVYLLEETSMSAVNRRPAGDCGGYTVQRFIDETVFYRFF